MAGWFYGYSNTENGDYKKLVEKLLLIKHDSPSDIWMECFDIMDDEDLEVWYIIEENGFPSKVWTIAHHAAFYSAKQEVMERLCKNYKALLYLKDKELPRSAVLH